MHKWVFPMNTQDSEYRQKSKPVSSPQQNNLFIFAMRHPVQDIDSQPENDPSNPGIGPLRPPKSCDSSSEKPAKRKHPWIRNYGLRNILTSLEKSPERSPEKSHGWFKPMENKSEEKAIKIEVTDDLVLNVDMNVAIDKSAADIDLKVETEDYETMKDEKDGT